MGSLEEERRRKEETLLSREAERDGFPQIQENPYILCEKEFIFLGFPVIVKGVFPYFLGSFPWPFCFLFLDLQIKIKFCSHFHMNMCLFFFLRVGVEDRIWVLCGWLFARMWKNLITSGIQRKLYYTWKARKFWWFGE